MNDLKKNKFIILFLLTTFCNISFAQMLVKTSFVVFNIKNGKLTVDGTFSGTNAFIFFEPTKLATSSFEGKIETKTISTGIKMRDNHLKKAEFFDSEKFPEITLKSKSIIADANGKYKAICILTIKGKTKQVDLPFTYNLENKTATFNGTLNINRLDFGIGGTSAIMANIVQINIKIVAVN